MSIKYNRVLIKLSGEALAGDDRFGVNQDVTLRTAHQIKEIRENGVDVAIVVGGGNFFRGRTGGGIDRVTADYMGMLATVMNALALQDSLLSIGCGAKVMTAIEIRYGRGVFEAQGAGLSGRGQGCDIWRWNGKSVLLH